MQQTMQNVSCTFNVLYSYWLLMAESKAVEDRMFLRMQDFDFCLNLIKFYPIYPNFDRIDINFAKI